MTDDIPGEPVVVIGGPTASGKSALALEIAEDCGGVVINADSMQLYADLRILTARPSDADMARAPHRLYGTLDGGERSSVARWRYDAVAAIRTALSKGRVPVVVGGTGMYLKALMQGLSPVPPSDPEFRAAATARHRHLGAAAFHADLERLDPEMASRLHPGDTQRCLRAWEVITATGRSLADWQRQPPAGPPPGMTFLPVTLTPEREALYRACENRFRQMIDAGAIDEVRHLQARTLPPDLPVMKAVGVPELVAYLNDQITLEVAIGLAQQATRRYAKRQLTWFRHQGTGGQRGAPADPPAGDATSALNLPICTQYSKRLAPKILSLIRFSR